MNETLKVVEWDCGPAEGSYVFELTVGEARLVSVYVVRFMDRTYKHMNSSFEDVTDTLNGEIKNQRELTVISYMTNNIEYFF